MIFGQIRESLREFASKFFVGFSETGILKPPHIAIRVAPGSARFPRTGDTLSR